MTRFEFLNTMMGWALVGEGEGWPVAAGFSGVVLVVREGKVLFEHVAGWADREGGRKVERETRFRIGSLNKMFTSVAALGLVERGKLELDVPVGKWLSEYANREVREKVTLRHLLTHTAGMGDYFGPEYRERKAEMLRVGDYVKLFGERGPEFEPGTRGSYSNYGFVLVGALIEAVTGRDYYEYVEEQVYAKAGMKRSGSRPEREMVGEIAQGYEGKAGAEKLRADLLVGRGTPAGGGYATAGDLVRFGEALLDGKLLGKEMLREATRNHKAKGRGYGLGFGVNVDSFGHVGGAPGTSAALRVYPGTRTMLAVLSNVDEPGAMEVEEAIAARL